MATAPENSVPDATGQWAVVLGVSSGSGAAIGLALAQSRGLDLFGLHRGHYPEAAATLANQVAACGQRAEFLVDDAGNADAAERGAQQLLKIAGPRSVKVLVHAIANGSVGHLVGPKPMHAKQVQKTFDAMAHSFLYWVQALVAHDFLAPGARIFGLSNPCCESLLHNVGVISAAKAALEMYVRHLAFELGPHGFRVNLIKYGAVETAALKHIFTDDAWKNLVAQHAAMIPAGRMVTVQEVVDLVALLMSDAALWFNGATIDFSGGQAQSLYNAMMHPHFAHDASPRP